MACLWGKGSKYNQANIPAFLLTGKVGRNAWIFHDFLAISGETANSLPFGNLIFKQLYSYELESLRATLWLSLICINVVIKEVVCVWHLRSFRWVHLHLNFVNKKYAVLDVIYFTNISSICHWMGEAFVPSKNVFYLKFLHIVSLFCQRFYKKINDQTLEDLFSA